MGLMKNRLVIKMDYEVILISFCAITVGSDILNMKERSASMDMKLQSPNDMAKGVKAGTLYVGRYGE